VISAPSGCGKTTILQHVFKRVDGLGFSVSHTTRPKRSGEVDGVDYHFVDLNTFQEIRDAGGFVETANVHSNQYGTSVASIDQLLRHGVDVVLDIDVQGKILLNDVTKFDFVSIFILPPSITELEERLRNRNTDSLSVISARLKNAVAEIKSAPEYDYSVVNDNLYSAVDDVVAIVKAERLRSVRLNSFEFNL